MAWKAPDIGFVEGMGWRNVHWTGFGWVMMEYGMYRTARMCFGWVMTECGVHWIRLEMVGGLIVASEINGWICQGSAPDWRRLVQDYMARVDFGKAQNSDSDGRSEL
ncbi:hypothetical protein BDR07DRAFT_1381342 [Suillus spraguei]|nr:hypothetical protein BDR07DRAFT_1381342 [Suillus spraguei]